jgi:hypothetical protein
MEALLDSVLMVPLLLVIYIGIELVEYKFGNKIIGLVQKAGVAGPAVGALAGSLPQCGISVVATALYTQRLATIGTLLAVYLSTSDEALPIILSHPDKAGLIMPLLLVKICIALVSGLPSICFSAKPIKAPWSTSSPLPGAKMMPTMTMLSS